MGEVALPALAHAHYGAAGYGALLASLAVGGIAGTLGAAEDADPEDVPQAAEGSRK